MDRERVEAAKRGDQEAYADLVRPRADRLFATAYRILRDVDRAEDALQEALVIAWRDLSDLRDPDRFDAWMHRLLVNAVSSRRCVSAVGSPIVRALPVDGPAGPDQFLSVADRDQLERGFRRLSPDQRAILVLPSLLGPGADRDRRRARHPGRHGPTLDCITPTAPCAPSSKRTSGRLRSEEPRHDAGPRP